MKKQLAEDMVQFITPIRGKAETIYEDKSYLKRVIEEGAEKARASANKTIEKARELIGLNYI
jgi:tryptophanyl-tRNA synthetase